MRTIQEIREGIYQAFQANPILNVLDYKLPTSVEGALVAVFTQIIWLFELLFDAKMKEVQAEADKAEQYVAPWYVHYTQVYQHGDTLIWDSTLLKYKYATTNVDLQVVKFVSVTPTNAGGVIVKCAKSASGGVPVKLDAVEQPALQGYWDNLAPVGTPVEVRSEDPDLLHLELTIKYDTYLPLPTIKAQVEQAIIDYLANLDFNGVFRTSKLIDAVQAVNGVVDAWVTVVNAKPATGAYAPVSNEYNAYAGYMMIDSAFPLSTYISYIA